MTSFARSATTAISFVMAGLAAAVGVMFVRSRVRSRRASRTSTNPDPRPLCALDSISSSADNASLRSGGDGDGTRETPAATVDVPIYFGSQTGTAENFARTIAEAAVKVGAAETPGNVRVTTIDLEDFDEEEFSKRRFCILVLATYGEGDPTDSAVKFDKWLNRQRHEPGFLSKMHFAVLGLGNRQYSEFNAMARRTEKSLKKWGASPICSRGEADDDGDIEGDLHKWMGATFTPALRGFLRRTPPSLVLLDRTVSLDSATPSWKANRELVSEGRREGVSEGGRE
eukprot:GHVU01071171.1.p1 GENE.GHVU01071171.1~~GHVU01071171.1.p1  ORF type:complete len:285 (-),score=46.78 GHVU01071171.1:91-945(-)